MPSQSSLFQGVWVPLVTPFSGGAVDGGALRRLVRHYAAAGVDGLVVCGSTGKPRRWTTPSNWPCWTPC